MISVPVRRAIGWGVLVPFLGRRALRGALVTIERLDDALLPLDDDD